MIIISIGLTLKLAVSETTRFHSRNLNVQTLDEMFLLLHSLIAQLILVSVDTALCWKRINLGQSVKWLVSWQLLLASGRSRVTLCHIFQFEMKITFTKRHELKMRRFT